jgi:hypothetical protein
MSVAAGGALTVSVKDWVTLAAPLLSVIVIG